MPGQAWNMWEAKSRKKASPPSFDPAALLSGGGGGGGGAKIVKWPERKRVRQKIRGGKERKEAEGERGHFSFYTFWGRRGEQERGRDWTAERKKKKEEASFVVPLHQEVLCSSLLLLPSVPKRKRRRRAAHLTCFF